MVARVVVRGGLLTCCGGRQCLALDEAAGLTQRQLDGF